MKAKCIVFIVLITINHFHLSACDTIENIIVGFSDNPPYAYMDNGTPVGIRVDLARATIERMGCTFEPRIYPWARALEYLKDGIIDGLVMWKTEERQKFAYFPEYTFTLEQTAIYRKSGTPTIEYSSLEDFHGLTIGIIRGYGYSKDFLENKDIIIEEVTEHSQNFNKLIFNRIDASLMSSDSGDYNIRLLGLKNKVYRNPDLFDPGIWDYLCFSKKTINSQLLASQYDEVIQSIIDDGTYDLIFEKYLKRGPLISPLIISDGS